ncbi:MAG: phosphoribosylformylglycinamidine synthase, partial [Nitrospirae bacterium]
NLSNEELNTLLWLIGKSFEPNNVSESSFLSGGLILEVGPRLNFTTAWSTNAVSICSSCCIQSVSRIERSRRYCLVGLEQIGDEEMELFLKKIHDRMTECLYEHPLESFEIDVKPEPVFVVPLIEEGVEALKGLNKEMGLGFDEDDIAYYYDLFVNKIGRNPTNVECFDLAQSNSEHSRHWFFRGRLIIDGEELQETLMDIVKTPLKKNPSNSIIAFSDNSSAIRGYVIKSIIPEDTLRASPMVEKELLYHIIFTAETHNFPCGVAPFPGAETGTGGRIRDVQATGRGGLVVAGTAGYCVGNLNIPGYKMPWEDEKFSYPKNLSSPLEIEIEASNGASDYGNKFGEPLIQGFTRSTGILSPDGQRWEWIKPIMFTGGVGQIDDRHREKKKPERGMLIVKVGGPAYRIGMGGGAASSMLQGENVEELDFNAVQRGDAEMEQKMNRVIRACIEMGDKNPIVTIHDQGAGGNSNVIKELVYPEGGFVEIRNILAGDKTLSVLELWGAEYQENNALLLHPEHADIFKELCNREKVPFSFIGEITGDGRIVVHDSLNDTEPVNMDLSMVLGGMPNKTFHLKSPEIVKKPLILPDGLSVKDALNRVLRLLQVGSKRFLTNKVDRSVTGLIAQQQCVGPLHIPLSDVSVIAQSHFSLTGAAISIGEQPLKSLLDPAAMARLSVTEALTNLVWAVISGLGDVKCSANWMWAPKLPGEGVRLYEAAVAMRDIMCELGIAVDGGKDSLSMATSFKNREGEDELVKSPPTLVISAYATVPNIEDVVTPDLKIPDKGIIIHIDLSKGKRRTGGSALSQVFSQLGDTSPDLEDAQLLKNTFNTVQELIKKGLITAGHDISDGGLIITLLEMAFAGDTGIEINIEDGEHTPIEHLFAEEPGLVFECSYEDEDEIMDMLKKRNIPAKSIGRTLRDNIITITYNGEVVLKDMMNVLRAIWEETSFRLERLQASGDCVRQEHICTFRQKRPPYSVTFNIEKPKAFNKRPKVAILREEGSNGDREMASAFYMAGFEPWDVMMTDLLNRRIKLEQFSGIAFVGGFSYADVLGAAKGWAGVIRFNKELLSQFDEFYNRDDTFSLGVCNGCQLMALLGWVPWKIEDDQKRPVFIKNDSNRFESRFSTVKILNSPSIMLRGMEDSILGIWVAHGEGKLYFPDEHICDEVLKQHLAPIRYVDDEGKITRAYPFNPNGSPHGITALCSPDGRHLAMMPHPERTFLKWQWPWMPKDMRDMEVSPWLKMFENARVWYEERG